MTEEALFHEALALSSEARSAYLDRVCAGKPELRASLEGLIAAHEASQNPLDQSLDAGTGAFTPEPGGGTADFQSHAGAGVVIAGRYTLEQKIGEGGMGEVWVAKQSEPVKRKVALKLIKAGMDSKAVLQRFEQERQALAMMDHPNIAKVLDGGLTGEPSGVSRRVLEDATLDKTRPLTRLGSPYFVMELVNGLPLTRFCDEAKLGIRERLELFVPICQAVQHAHQKGIVHRDLKPSNILVTIVDGKPVPKVIDFGVAKATGGKLTDESMSTQFGAVIGTLEYMSPEQAGFAGIDVDTRADIYSLGVILYELLTGLRPFDAALLKKAAFDEMIRMIREDEPSKPSTRLSTDQSLPSLAAIRQMDPKRLTRLLKGELDWVVMKCLEKQRDRRYESANGLARDIQRYLADEPVEARPPSVTYRAKKFLRRNKGPVVAGLVVLLVLVGGIVGTSVGMVRAELRRREAVQARTDESIQRGIADQKRHEADEARKRAIVFRDRALNALRATTSDDVAKLIGEKKQLTANERDYLEAIAKRWQEFARGVGTDEQSKRVQCEGHERVGNIWLTLRRLKEAMVEYEASLEIANDFVKSNPEDPTWLWMQGRALSGLATTLADTGEAASALAKFELSVATRERICQIKPDWPDYQHELAVAHFNLAYLHILAGRFEKARSAFERSRDVTLALTKQHKKNSAYRAQLASVYKGIGFMCTSQGKLREALEHYENGLHIMGELVEQNPKSATYRLELATSNLNLGTAADDLGDKARAFDAYRKARDILSALVKEYPAMPEYAMGLGRTHINLSAFYREAGKTKESFDEVQKAIASQRKLVELYPDNHEYQLDLAQSHYGLGITYYAFMQKHREASAELKRALEIRRQFCDPSRLDHLLLVAETQNLLGLSYTTQREWKLGRVAFEETIAILTKLLPKYANVVQIGDSLVAAYGSMGRLTRDEGNAADSIQWFDKAIEAIEGKVKQGTASPRVQSLLWQNLRDRAVAYIHLDNHGAVLVDLTRSLKLAPLVEKRDVRFLRAHALLHTGNLAEAVAEAVELRKIGPARADQWYILATIHFAASEDPKTAKPDTANAGWEMLKKAVEMGLDTDLLDHKDLASIRRTNEFKNLLERSQKPAEKKP